MPGEDFKKMRVRIATLVIVATGFVLFAGMANAKSDKETCVSTTTGQVKTNGDGTHCNSAVSGSGPNLAMATASKKSDANATAEDGGTATASATKAGEATAQGVSGVASASHRGRWPRR